MRKLVYRFIRLAVLTALHINAGAHNLWLTASDYRPSMGKSIDIRIGWGHKFPADEKIKPGMLKEISALDPDGKKVELGKKSDDHFTLAINKEGVYTVMAANHPVFFSQTTEGRKKGDKKELPNVVSCTHYDMAAKLIIVAGNKMKGFSCKTGQSLEILPSAAGPGALNEGAELSVNVQLMQKPLAHLQIFGTYAGFSDDPQTFAYATMTDNGGNARIKLHKKGLWIIKADAATPYADKGRCDENSYRQALTIEVR